MSDLFNEIAQIISNVSSTPIDKILPESHLVNDLQVDSLGILDATFDIEKKYNIKIPIETLVSDLGGPQGVAFTSLTVGYLVTKIQAIIDSKPQA